MKSRALSSLVLSLIEGSEPSRPAFVTDSNYWEAALEYSRGLHATVPFLLGLERCPWKSELPFSVKESFETERRRGRMVLALLDHELTLALAVLKSVGIEVLLLKGAELGRRYYPDRLWRPMTDVDLLVRESDYARTISELESRGYHSVGRFYPGRTRCELSRQGIAPVVEVHARILAGEEAADGEGYWRRSVPIVFSDLPHPVRVLEATDNLTYLVRHSGVQHLVESPLWLEDVRRLVENEDIDWARFTERAVQLHFSSAAWFVLTFSRAEVPAVVLAGLGKSLGSVRRALLRRVGKTLFPLGQRSRLWTFAARYLLRDGAAQALGYFLERRRRLSFASQP